jgi:hypothetical protein
MMTAALLKTHEADLTQRFFKDCHCPCGCEEPWRTCPHYVSNPRFANMENINCTAMVDEIPWWFRSEERLTAGRAAGAIFYATLTEKKPTRANGRLYSTIRRFIYVWANGDVWATKGTPAEWKEVVRKWIRDIRDVNDEPMKRRRIIARSRAIKEELMMNRWHPSRVERLLDLGYDVDDM